jgi:TP901 family phage tail tape measure protein
MSDVNINIRLVTTAAVAAAGKLGDKLKDTEKSAKSLGDSLGSIGTIARGVFLGNIIQTGLFTLTRAVTDLTFAFAEFEQQLVSIGKTTGLEGKALQDLGRGFQELSTEIPVTTEELLRLGTIAGQLGIQRSEDILKFTETVARLGSAVDGASVDDFAKQLSRIAGLTDVPIDQIDRLASAFVDLGNNVKANEAEIAAVALEVSKVASIYGVTADEVAGLSATFAELGISAELARSATLTTLRSITDAASRGGPKLEKFLELTNLTAEEFKDLAKNSPVEVVTLLSEGLGKLSEQGIDKVNESLRVLNLNEKRTATGLSALATQSDRLRQNVERSSVAFTENRALLEESNRAYDTQLSEVQLLKNEYNKFAQEVSEGTAPALTSIISKLRTVTVAMGQVTEATKEFLGLNEELSAADEKFNGQDLNQALLIRSEILSDINEKVRDQQEIIVFRQNLIDSAIGKEKEANKELLQQELIKLNSLKQIAAGEQDRVNAIRERIAAENEGAKTTPGAPAVPTGEPTIDEVSEYFAQRASIRAAFDAQELVSKQEQDLLEGLRLENGLSRLENFYIEQEKLRQQDKLAAEENATEKEKILADIGQKAADKARDAQKKAERKELEGKRVFQGQLNQLAANGSKEAFAIQKALAVQQAILNADKAVLGATAFGNEIGGPALGAIFGAIAKVTTAAQVASIVSAKPPSFQNGGIVPGTSFSGDNVEARVNSGEVILNRQQQAQTLFAIANGQSGSGQQRPQEIVSNITVELDGETVARAVSRQVADGMVLGENQ